MINQNECESKRIRRLESASLRCGATSKEASLKDLLCKGRGRFVDKLVDLAVSGIDLALRRVFCFGLFAADPKKTPLFRTLFMVFTHMGWKLSQERDPICVFKEGGAARCPPYPD